VLGWAEGTTRALGALLGVFETPPEQADAPDALADQLVALLIDLRQAARERKDFGLADAIRGRLADLGVTLEDRPDGTVWSRS